jgi:hypothetical protein
VPRLQAQFPLVADAVAGRPAPRVVVLAANLAHLLALAELLPGWPLCPIRTWAEDACLAPEQVKQLKERDVGWDLEAQFVVATPDGLGALALGEVDVVVRADAGADVPAVLEKKLVGPADGPERPLLLVDLDDQHLALRRQSRLRGMAYEQRGWLAPGADPVLWRVERLLAGRRQS